MSITSTDFRSRVSSSRFWQHARERKWLYLIVGAIVITLLVLAVQRSYWRPAYVVPATGLHYPDHVNDSFLTGPVNDRQLRFPATALGNFPVYPVGEGGQVMPYVNRSKTDLVVKEAYFFPKNAGRPIVPGVATPAYEVRFGPEHYDSVRQCWGRTISDLTLPAGAETRVVVHLIDPVRAGQRMYGSLVMRVHTGDLIQFEAAQIVVQPD